ncbi:MAG: hypothetical protein SH817_01085 [Leptospira sp.]|nr:hypothetical protein [Leptospira sp.]
MYLNLYKVLIVFFILVSESYAGKVNIFGTLKNGTFGGVGRADSIKLLALQGAMLPLADLGPQVGNFKFPELDAPEGAPILVQVVYQGVNYNKMIPPVPTFRNASQDVTVYELTDSKEKITIKSLMQVIREKNGLRVFKLFLIDNQSKPQKSYLSTNSPIEYYIPKDAKEVFAQVQQPNSKMAIPLQTPEGKNGGKILDRAALPGISELQVSYLIPNDIEILEERLLVEGDSPSFPIFLKPQDMKLEIVSGGTLSKLEKDIPSGLSAYAITATSIPKVIRFTVIGGKPIPAALRGNPEIINGTILTTWDTSLFAIVGFLALLFSLSFLFVYKKSSSQVNSV